MTTTDNINPLVFLLPFELFSQKMFAMDPFCAGSSTD